MPIGPQRQSGQQTHPETRGHQGLNGHEVLGLEVDPRGEADVLAGVDQMFAAPFASGDPPLLREVAQVRGGAARVAPRGHDVQRLVEQWDQRGVPPVDRGRLAVFENHCGIDLSRPERRKRLRRFRLG